MSWNNSWQSVIAIAAYLSKHTWVILLWGGGGWNVHTFVMFSVSHREGDGLWTRRPEVDPQWSRRGSPNLVPSSSLKVQQWNKIF